MKKLAIWLFLVIVVLGALAGAAAVVAMRRVDEPFRGYQGADQLVDIPQGLGTNAIGQRLVDAGDRPRLASPTGSRSG